MNFIKTQNGVDILNQKHIAKLSVVNGNEIDALMVNGEHCLVGRYDNIEKLWINYGMT